MAVADPDTERRGRADRGGGRQHQCAFLVSLWRSINCRRRPCRRKVRPPPTTRWFGFGLIKKTLRTAIADMENDKRKPVGSARCRVRHFHVPLHRTGAAASEPNSLAISCERINGFCVILAPAASERGPAEGQADQRIKGSFGWQVGPSLDKRVSTWCVWFSTVSAADGEVAGQKSLKSSAMGISSRRPAGCGFPLAG